MIKIIFIKEYSVKQLKQMKNRQENNYTRKNSTTVKFLSF